MPKLPDAQSPVIWLEIRRDNGTVERAVGADASALWRGIVQALNVAQTYGYPYAGPRLQFVTPPGDNPGEASAALEEGPAT
jgi:hypothetical protein